MRHVILLDNKITDEQYKAWKQEDISFWGQYIGMTPQYWVIRQDYTDYPTFIDSDGDTRPTDKYLQSLTDQVVSKYNDFGTDFIMVMIHRDNWKSTNPKGKGIWGTNYSYVFGKQCLDYCRWDSKNLANTFGTAWHERSHSLDAICQQELGVDVRPLLNVSRYDSEVTHGKGEKWDYIRWKENTRSLEIMSSFLRKAFSVRQQRHDDYMRKQKTIITLLTQIIYFLKRKLNQKNGVSKVIHS